MLSLFSTLLLAQVPPSAPGDDVFGWLFQSAKWVIEQFHSHNYGPAVGVIIMVLVWAFDKIFESKLPKAALPWVSSALGVVLAIAGNLSLLAAGYKTTDWATAVIGGLTTGAAASGFWSMLGKTLTGKLTGKPVDPPAAPPAA